MVPFVARARTLSEWMFLCGGLGVAAVAAAALIDSDAVRTMLVSATSFVVATHLGASVLRARRARLLRLVALAFVLAALLSCAVVLGGYDFFDILFTLLALVLPAHAGLQVFRVALVLALRRGATLRREWAVAATLCGVAASLAATFSGPRELLIWRGFLPLPVGTVFWGIGCVATAACAFISSRASSVRGRVTWMQTVVPLVAGAPLLVGAAVSPDWALSGPAALMHAAQLLALALVLEPRVARLEGRAFDPFAFVGFALAIGCGLVVVAPLLASRAAALDPTTVLLAAGGCAALAQALVDVPLWSLHDPNLLRSAGDAVVPAAHGRHLVSNARALAIATPIALVVGASLFEPILGLLLRAGDQATTAERVALARELFPADARIVVADARAALDAGDLEIAKQQLTHAERALSPDAVRLALLVCVEEREADALSCFDDVPRAFRFDLEIGALRLDRLDALGLFDDAAALAGALANEHAQDLHARALHGVALARLGREPARSLLESALDEMVAASSELDPVLARAAAWRGRIARIDGRRDEADRWLARAQKSAVEQDVADLAVFVFAERARLADAGGDARASLEAWKVALGAAEDAERPIDEADAFLGMEALLARSAGSAPARYACIAAARRALAPLTDARVASSTRARIDEAERALNPSLTNEERLGVDADLDAAIAQVAALSYEGAGAVAPGLADEAPPDQNVPR